MNLAFDTFTLRTQTTPAFSNPYRLEGAVLFIDKSKDEQPRGLVLGIDIAGEIAGVIAVHPFDDVYRRSAELGYWLAEPFCGRGIMTRAVRAICEQTFAKDRELVRLQASVFGWNPSSARVLEKAGFEREGVLRQSVFKDGVLADSWLYAPLR